jgi:predicted nucleic acid-binding protein
VAAVARFIADKSALARFGRSEVQAVLAPLIDAGLVATCAMVEFEMLWSTRSSEEFDRSRSDREMAYEWLPLEDVHWRRVLEVQAELWRTGQMRAVPLPDLLIAAVAESHSLTVLHYDADYDRIAAVTGQSTQWVVQRGTVP